MTITYTLKKALDLSDNQYNLIIIYTICFIVQTLCLLYLNPYKFNMKWFLLCFIAAIFYNVTYYKFFSE
jgi:hypothetical protein